MMLLANSAVVRPASLSSGSHGLRCLLLPSHIVKVFFFKLVIISPFPQIKQSFSTVILSNAFIFALIRLQQHLI